MDVVLNIADSLFLDAVWSKVVPITAFTPGNLNATTAGTWNSLVSHLPHPPLEQAVFSYANATVSGHNLSYSNISAWPRDYIPRQLLSLIVITLLGIHALYFIFASFSYYFIFNHDMMKHPRFLKNQVRLEIQTSLGSFPWMMLLTLPWFQGEVMGYSKLYYDVEEYGWTWLVLSVPL
jgi:Delta7-sterol 5-desaturase